MERKGINSYIIETTTINLVSIENSSIINNIVNSAISTKTLVNGVYSFPVGSNLEFTFSFTNVFILLIID